MRCEGSCKNLTQSKYWQVLEISEGFEEIGTPRIHLVLSLFFAWIIVFLVLVKGGCKALRESHKSSLQA